MKLVERFKKINWEEGSAELLSFCVMAPFIIVVIYIFLNISMMINAAQAAEYAAYIGGRTAVISISADVSPANRLSVAKSKANEVVRNSLDAYSMVSDYSKLEPYKWYGELKLDGENNVWTKGEYATYTVYLCVPSFYGSSNSGILSSSITMMVETPVAQGYSVK